MTVIGGEFAANPAQIENRIDPAQQMIGGNTIVEIKLIE
jgi:hypothetical protein|tara:strand:- start:165 stop:281 length:117 start_codon:yes stop_codon:yes gene_type:complete